jgi:hypothetical protein
LEESVIVAPPDGAGPVSVNDSVAFAPLVTVLGLIEKPMSVGRPGPVTVTVTLAVWLPPLYVAVTIVVVVAVIVAPDDSEKLAVL